MKESSILRIFVKSFLILLILTLNTPYLHSKEFNCNYYQNAKSLSIQELESRYDKLKETDIYNVSIEDLKQKLGEYLCYKNIKWETELSRSYLIRFFGDRIKKAGLKIIDPLSDEVYDKVLQVLTDTETRELFYDLIRGKGYLRILYEVPAKNIRIYTEDLYGKFLEFEVDFNDIEDIKSRLEPHISPKRFHEKYILKNKNSDNIITIEGNIRNSKRLDTIIKESQKLFGPEVKKIRVTASRPQFDDTNIEVERCLPQNLNHKNIGIVNISIADIREKPDLHPAIHLTTQAYMGEQVHILNKLTNTEGDWFHVKAPTGFIGYIKKEDVVLNPYNAKQNDTWLIVKEKMADIKLSSGEIIKAPFTSLLQTTEILNNGYSVKLPDRRTGYVKKESVELRNIYSAQNPTGKDVVELARKFLGIPYTLWHYTPKNTNCSHMVYLIYKYLGIKLPMDADLQFLVGQPVREEDLQPGDAVFFGNKSPIEYGSFLPGHVGIYIGNGNFIHNSTATDGMNITSMDSPYYSQRFIGTRRFIYPGAPKDLLDNMADKVIGFDDITIIFKKEITEK
ncbi:MAG: SH3 domain-containing C40 family peptidase [Armatimonadota bacterium]